MDKAKKIFGIFLIAFALYAVFTSPDQAAGIVRNIWEILANGVKSIGTFFSTILGK